MKVFLIVNAQRIGLNFHSEKLNIDTFNKCQSEAFEIMTNCTEQCDVSYECHQVCGSNYYEELRSCPCMEQCPGS